MEVLLLDAVRLLLEALLEHLRAAECRPDVRAADFDCPGPACRRTGCCSDSGMDC